MQTRTLVIYLGLFFNTWKTGKKYILPEYTLEKKLLSWIFPSSNSIPKVGLRHVPQRNHFHLVEMNIISLRWKSFPVKLSVSIVILKMKIKLCLKNFSSMPPLRSTYNDTCRRRSSSFVSQSSQTSYDECCYS